jgi:hypothetical protein
MSSSFPGHKMRFCQTAWTFENKTTSHNITKKTVIPDVTPLIAELSSTFPICISARVRPEFGNTNAHQVRVKTRCLNVAIPAMALRQKNQNPKSQRKMPATAPNTLSISPARRLLPRKSVGRISLARTPRDTKARAVYARTCVSKCQSTLIKNSESGRTNWSDR